MHNKIAKLLSGADETLHITNATEKYEFVATKEPIISQIRVYGKSDSSLTGLGTMNYSFGTYDVTIRITGENPYTAAEYRTLMTKNYGSGTTYSSNVLSFTPPTIDKSWITSANYEFKPNTVYTLRFYFIGVEDGQCTGFAFEYDDGSYDAIYGGAAAGATVGGVSAAGKTVTRIRSVYTNGKKCKINMTTFGLYEGAHDIGNFIECQGGTRDYRMASRLCSDSVNGVEIADYLDWKRLETVHFFENNTLSGENLEPCVLTPDITVAAYRLPYPADMKTPLLQMEDFNTVPSVKDMIKSYESMICTVSDDGNYIYLMQSMFNGYDAIVQHIGSLPLRFQYKLATPIRKEVGVPSVVVPTVGKIYVKATSNKTCKFRIYTKE